MFEEPISNQLVCICVYILVCMCMYIMWSPGVGRALIPHSYYGDGLTPVPACISQPNKRYCAGAWEACCLALSVAPQLAMIQAGCTEDVHMRLGCAGNGAGESSSSSHREDQVHGQRLVYSNRCGRILLNNVTVQNRGVDWAHEGNIYWQHKVGQLGASSQPVNCFASQHVLPGGVVCSVQCLCMHQF